MTGERERLAPDASVVEDWEQLAIPEGLAAAISPLCFANLMEISLAGSRRISSALIDALGSSMPGALQSCALPVSGEMPARDSTHALQASAGWIYPRASIQSAARG